MPFLSRVPGVGWALKNIKIPQRLDERLLEERDDPGRVRVTRHATRPLWRRHRARELATVYSPMNTRVVDKDVEEHDEEGRYLLVQDDPVQHLLQDRLGQCDTTSAGGNDSPLDSCFGHLGADEMSLIVKHLPDGVLVFALVCTTFRIAVQRCTGSRQMWSTVAHVSCIMCRNHACV